MSQPLKNPFANHGSLNTGESLGKSRRNNFLHICGAPWRELSGRERAMRVATGLLIWVVIGLIVGLIIGFT